MKYKNDVYNELRFSRKQIRDCIKGSNAIKRNNEVYLPMPSAMNNTQVRTNYTPSGLKNNDISFDDLPWYHPNPAYSAYLNRAKFPDITANILSHILGLATKGDNQIKLSSSIKYLEDYATSQGGLIQDTYAEIISEVFQAGKHCIVLNPTIENRIEFVLMRAESNTDWEYENINGKRKLVSCSFIIEKNDKQEKTIKYYLVNDIAVYQEYIDGKESGEETPILLQGKSIDLLPIFFTGSQKNNADQERIPLLGISDIALTIYRKSADLNHAHFLTCTPTLFIYGITEEQTPKVVGSSVVVAISNPEANADYPKTDTAGLGSVKEDIREMFEEAANSVGQMTNNNKKSAESGEALGIKQANSGLNLLNVVRNTSKTLKDCFDFCSKWHGDAGQNSFAGSEDFVEKTLSAQETNSLVSSWLDGAISHDTLLDKLRDVNIVSGDATNEQEKEKIKKEEENRMNMQEKTNPNGQEKDDE